MRWNLALAFSVSLLLVGYASWSRFTTASTTTPNLIAVESQATNEADYQEILNDFLEPKATSSTPVVTQAQPLTKTDMLSRELFSDYIGLAGSGQATEGTITALANKYVENLPKLNSTEVVSFSDLRVVSNTKANFQKYAEEFAEIENTFAEALGSNDSPLSFSKAYTVAAKSLKKTGVPSALTSQHLQLINSYLLSSTGMEVLSRMDSDPTTAFSGLVAVNEDLEKEAQLIKNITDILKSNGI
ncbi:MAG: hypothetical protein Q7R67_00300 [bacterium]|nr:hypothetical protein [bacterium]